MRLLVSTLFNCTALILVCAASEKATAHSPTDMVILKADTSLGVANGKVLTLMSGALGVVVEEVDGRVLILTERIHLTTHVDRNDVVICGWVPSTTVVSLEIATRDLTSRISESPDDVAALLGLANVQSALQHPKEAIALLSRALAADEGNVVLLLRRADALRRAGRFAESIADSSDAIRRSPTLVPAYRSRALARCEIGAFDEAILDCKQALSVNPKSHAAFVCRGFLRVMTDDLEAAQLDVEESQRFPLSIPRKEESKKGIDVLFAVVDAWDRDTNTVTNWPAMRRILNMHRALGGMEDLVLQGVMAERTDTTYDAICMLTIALMLPLPPRAEVRAHYHRARAHTAHSEHREALKDASEAVRIVTANPDAASPQLTLQALLAEETCCRANTWVAAGKLDNAIADYDEAIRLNPRLEIAYLYRGAAWCKKGEFEKGQRDLSKMLEFPTGGKKDRAAALGGRGASQIPLGKRDSAMDDLNLAIQIKPNLAELWGYRALLRAELRDYDGAIADANEIVRLQPNMVFSYRSRAAVWYMSGRLDRCLEDYDTALRLDSRDPETLGHRGMVLLEVGEFAKAVTDFERAIRNSPNNTLSHHGLATLRAASSDDTFRDGAAAVRYATRACEFDIWKDGRAQTTLALAYAETGNFEDAQKSLQRAMELRPKKDVKFRDRLKIAFENKMPYRMEVAPLVRQASGVDNLPFPIP